MLIITALQLIVVLTYSFVLHFEHDISHLMSVYIYHIVEYLYIN